MTRSKGAEFDTEHTGEGGEGGGVSAADDGKVRLKAHFHTFFDDAAAIVVGLNDDRSARKLLRLKVK